MRRGEECATPHGETPYSPTSLLRALTADPYSVDPLREDEHPLESATPPDNRRMRAVTLLLAVLLGFAVAVSVVVLVDVPLSVLGALVSGVGVGVMVGIGCGRISTVSGLVLVVDSVSVDVSPLVLVDVAVSLAPLVVVLSLVAGVP